MDPDPLTNSINSELTILTEGLNTTASQSTQYSAFAF